jgi:hypothetical protein
MIVIGTQDKVVFSSIELMSILVAERTISFESLNNKST